jgi:hypothetical protein
MASSEELKRKELRQLIRTAFLLSLLLSLAGCVGLPARASNPPASFVKATEGQTRLPTITADATEISAQVPADKRKSEALTRTPAEDPKPVLKTSIGDFMIDSSRWVEEVNGVKPGLNEKILLVLLAGPGQTRLDPNNFSLEAFDKALRDFSSGEVHISGDDGSYTICPMAGWVGANYEEFAMGFRLPTTAKTFQLVWPGNEPIPLYPVD